MVLLPTVFLLRGDQLTPGRPLISSHILPTECSIEFKLNGLLSLVSWAMLSLGSDWWRQRRKQCLQIMNQELQQRGSILAQELLARVTSQSNSSQ
jgi:hypothetical protein